MIKNISKNEFILKEYFSMEYLLKYGYFDFKYNSYKFEEDYILSNIVFKKIFNTTELESVYLLIKKKVKFNSFKETVPLELSTYKNDNERRLLKLPNMYSYICLCEHLNKNQDIYMDVLAASNKSLSNSFYSITFLSNKIIRENNRIGKRKLFKTDIQNFYPSLYTHSIPWIFVGKVEAKRMKDDKKIYYNALDNLIQRCQMGETHGLPTGSFASRLIAEIYMCKLDLRLKDYEYVRYVDDFELPHNDESEKNLFYKKLNKELTNLNLKIKVEKNQVDSFPFHESNNSAFYFDYFTNNSGTKNNQRKRVYNFIEECISKEKEGYKGSLKLMFKALENSIYKSQLDREVFTINMLNKLFNFVLMKPKLSVYYLEFIDVLNKNDEVKFGLQKLQEEIRININRYIDLDYSEELYSLLSIFYYLDIVTICTAKQLFEVIKQMDDLSSTLAFEILLQDQININDLLFEALELKLENSISWQEEFWFFKYHTINRINLDKKNYFIKAIKIIFIGNMPRDYQKKNFSIKEI